MVCILLPLNKTKGALLRFQAQCFREKRPPFPFSLAAGKAEARRDAVQALYKYYLYVNTFAEVAKDQS